MKHNIKHTSFSKETLERLNNVLTEKDAVLSIYAEQLMWWNNKINLISRGVSRETILEHIKHSLLLYDFIRTIGASKVIDTGSGGGLPGIPLAICFPEKEFLLNDIVSKKMLAVKQIVKSLEVQNIRTETKSIAQVKLEGEELIITKHAFKVNELVAYLGNKNWGKIIFLKGENEVTDELTGIESQLNITITNLDKVIESEFYKGKAIVEVEKSNE